MPSKTTSSSSGGGLVGTGGGGGGGGGKSPNKSPKKSAGAKPSAPSSIQKTPNPSSNLSVPSASSAANNNASTSTSILTAIETGSTAAVLQWATDAETINSALDDKGNTALHWACRYPGRMELCLALIERGANVNAKNFLDATPLHWACKQGNLEQVQLLLSRGADPTMKNNVGKSALELATQTTITDCLKQAMAMATTVSPDLFSGGPAPSVPSVAVRPFERPGGSAKRTASARRRSLLGMLPPQAPGVGGLTSMNSSPARPGLSIGGSPNDKTAYMVETLRTEVVALKAQKEQLEMQMKSEAKQRQEEQEAIDSLRQQLSTMQKEKYMLEVKASGFEEMKSKVDGLQKEKIRLEVELQQKVLEQEEVARKLQTDIKSDYERALQVQTQLAAATEAEKKRNEARIKLLTESLERESEAKVALDKALAAKTTECTEAQTALRGARAERVKLEVEMKHLQEAQSLVTRLQKEISLMKLDAATAEETKAILNNVQQAKVRVEAELHEAQRQIAEQAAAHTVVQKQTQEQMNALKAEIDHLMAFKCGIDELIKEKSKLEVQVRCLEDENERYRREHGASAGHSESLRKLISQQQQEIAQLSVQLEEQTEQLTKQRHSEDNYQKERQTAAQLTVDLAGALGMIESLKNELNGLQAQHQRATSELADKTAESKRLAREKAAVEAELGEFRATHEDIDHLKRRAMMAEAETQGHRLTIKELTDQINAHHSQNQSLESKIAQYSQMIERVKQLEHEKADMSEQLKAQEEELDRMSQQINFANQQLFATQEVYSKEKENLNMVAQKQVNSVRDEMALVQQESMRLKVMNKELETELLELKSTAVRLRGEKEDRERAALEATQKLQTMQTQFDDMSWRLKQLQKDSDGDRANNQVTVREKDKQLAELTEMVTGLRSEAKSSRQELSEQRVQHQREMANLRDELQQATMRETQMRQREMQREQEWKQKEWNLELGLQQEKDAHENTWRSKQDLERQLQSVRQFAGSILQPGMPPGFGGPPAGPPMWADPQSLSRRPLLKMKPPISEIETPTNNGRDSSSFLSAPIGGGTSSYLGMKSKYDVSGPDPYQTGDTFSYSAKPMMKDPNGLLDSLHSDKPSGSNADPLPSKAEHLAPLREDERRQRMGAAFGLRHNGIAAASKQQLRR